MTRLRDESGQATAMFTVFLASLVLVVAVGAVLERLVGLRLAGGRRPVIRGLVFRKPPALDVVWDAVVAS